MKKLFGTDGIRGEVGGEKINETMAFRIGEAMVQFCAKRKLPLDFIIGRDTRGSGEKLEQAVIAGIVAGGGQVELTDVIPTPVLAHASRDYSLGLMITASHNDYHYNGFKFFSAKREKLSDTEELEMEDYILSSKNEINLADTSSSKNKKAKDNYVSFLIEHFQGQDFQDKKIILDCAQGATYELAPIIFGKFCSQVKALFTEPDGTNINHECGSQYPEELRGKVVQGKVDIGFAFDGDGDRLIVVDEKGTILTGDHIMYIIGKMMKEKGELDNNLIISTVMSNIGFVKKIQSLGINYKQTAVGDSVVYAGMLEVGAVLGGEEAGHIIFSKVLASGDGMFCALKLMEALNHFKKPLSALAQEFMPYPKLLENVVVKEKVPLEELPELKKTIKEVETELGDDGRVVVRYSGTEPKLRVMVEARAQKEVEKYVQLITEKVEKLLNS